MLPKDEKRGRIARLRRIGQRVGLALLVLATAAWVVSFPLLPALWALLTGAGRDHLNQWGADAFFQQHPQIITYSFLLGAALWFGLRVSPRGVAEGRSAEAKAGAAKEERALWAKAGAVWPDVLRFGAIPLLGAIMALAANGRIAAPLDLAHSTAPYSDNYDEGIFAETALLLTKGVGLYTHVLFDQPPMGVALWSLPLRFEHSDLGNFYDLLRLRLFNGILAVLVVAVVYLIGRRLAGPIAGLVAALVLAADNGAVHTDQRLFLETPVNLCVALEVLAFLYAAPHTRGWRRWLPLLLAGLWAGFAVTVKIPALTGGVALGLSLLLTRRWRDTLVFGIGGALGFLPITAFFLLASGGEYLKQAYIERLLEPVNALNVGGSDATPPLYIYLYQQSGIRLTLVLAMCGLVALILRWLWLRQAERWLPVVLLAVITLALYSGKAGFYSHYYGQIALPLALLAGGGVLALPKNLAAVGRLRRYLPMGAGVVISAALVSLVGVLLPIELRKQTEMDTFDLGRVSGFMSQPTMARPGPLYGWDSTFNFVTGRSLTRDPDGRYIVDSIAFAQYTVSGLRTASLPQAVGQLFGPGNQATRAVYTAPELTDVLPSPVVQTDLRNLALSARYTVNLTFHNPFTPKNLTYLTRRLIPRYRDKAVVVYERADHLVGTTFGGATTLLSYDGPKRVNAGQPLSLVLHWQQQKAGPVQYQAVLRLRSGGDVVAVQDVRPLLCAAAAPCPVKTGQVYDDRYTLVLPPNLAPGRYTLEARLMEEPNRRVLLPDSGGRSSVVFGYVAVR